MHPAQRFCILPVYYFLGKELHSTDSAKLFITTWRWVVITDTITSSWWIIKVNKKIADRDDGGDGGGDDDPMHWDWLFFCCGCDIGRWWEWWN